MKQPLYDRIRTEIEARILSGELAPGSQLPFEHELMRTYDCSRMTVSKALSALSGSGLIERRKRAGSFVARPRIQSMVLDVPDLKLVVEERGQTHAFRMLTRKIRLADAFTDGALSGSGRLMVLQGLHLADGSAFALETRQISLTAVPDIEDVDFEEEAPGSSEQGNIPWTEAESSISAIGADLTEAELLGVSHGAACLSVERYTWRGTTPITHVRQLFPGKSYQLIARFGPA